MFMSPPYMEKMPNPVMNTANKTTTRLKLLSPTDPVESMINPKKKIIATTKA